MKKYRLTLLFILSFILFPITINGAVCTNSDKVTYQSLAKNISISYDYVEENENATFNATFVNIPEGFYIKDLDTKQVYNYIGSEMTINGLEQGKKYRYGIYTTIFSCENILLYTHYLNLPYYNPYYRNELCQGIENFKYCNKWINKKITYEEFEKNIKDYLVENDTTQVEKDAEQVSLINLIAKFYLKYYIIILPIVIITGIIIIEKYNKKNDFF